MENDIKEERNTESYKERMNIDIENINTIENRNEIYRKQWRNIHEVIQLYFFNETDIFLDDFIKICNNNANEAPFLPLEVKIT